MNADSEIADIDAQCWQALQLAVADAESPFRYITLCSVDRQAQPRARILVLRAVSQQERLLEFHTDVRSPKWQEFSAQPKATVLGYAPQERVQVRFEGHVTLHAPGDIHNTKAWQSLSHWTRTTYHGGPPGDELVALPAAELPEAADQLQQPEDGRKRFGVVLFHAVSLDWFRLRRNDNRRAILRYDTMGRVLNGGWVNP